MKTFWLKVNQRIFFVPLSFPKIFLSCKNVGLTWNVTVDLFLVGVSNCLLQWIDYNLSSHLLMIKPPCLVVEPACFMGKAGVNNDSPWPPRPRQFLPDRQVKNLKAAKLEVLHAKQHWEALGIWRGGKFYSLYMFVPSKFTIIYQVHHIVIPFVIYQCSNLYHLSENWVYTIENCIMVDGNVPHL